MHSAIVQTTPAEGFNMLDLDWERYVPLMDIHIDDIQKIFAQYDKTLTVSGFEAIRLGCRNRQGNYSCPVVSHHGALWAYIYLSVYRRRLFAKSDGAKPPVRDDFCKTGCRGGCGDS